MQVLLAAGATAIPDAAMAVVLADGEWLFELERGQRVKIEVGMTQREINSILGNVIGPLQLSPSMCPITVRNDSGSLAFDGSCRLISVTARR